MHPGANCTYEHGFRFSKGKLKTMIFSETTATCDLKVGRCRQIIEQMKVFEYSRSMTYLDIDPRSFTYEDLNLLFSETIEPISTKLCMPYM